MRNYHSNEIVNVAVLGHSGSGKTSVIEAMAYRAGITNRIGTIQEGNTICDYDDEEVRRQSSISLAVVPLEWNDHKINILDTPGAFDFAGEVQAALKVAESALIVVPATEGLSTGTRQAMNKTADMPRMIYINGVDKPNANYQGKLEEIQKAYGAIVAPIQVPIMERGKMVGYVNVEKMEGRRFEGSKTVPCDIPADLVDEVEAVRAMIDEAVANTDDDLLEKFLMEEPFTAEEISAALKNGVVNKTLIPVLCGADTIGISTLMNSMTSFFPTAGDERNTIKVHNTKTNEDEEINFDASKAPAAFVFKTFADPFVGRISLFKVLSGTLKTNMTLKNNGRDERMGKLYTMTGKNMTEVDELQAGDIGAVSKLIYTKTNDCLNTAAYPITVDPIVFPQAFYGQAVTAKGKGAEDKISQALNRILEEDPSLKFEANAETKQQVLYGLGDIHVETVVSKLKNKFKIEVNLDKLKVPYRETIRGEVTQRTKYKKQSGGHGQYGDVAIKFEPSGDYDKPYIFEEQVFGGAVPKAYFPAVEKGLQLSVDHGVLAGYPVLGLKATLLDGSYHPVDSSEQAFKTATSMCFKEALPKAKPTLLEPYVTVNTYCPEEYM
ncbi:MAG: elongation factor G, partial [bacterium]